MKKRLILFFTALTIIGSAFKQAGDVDFYTPKGWPKPLHDFKTEPLTAAKIALGRKLFFDPLLSRNNTISCASCHLPQTAFTHIDHDLSHGIDGKIGTRNSPSLVNLAWSKHFMWDGRRASARRTIAGANHESGRDGRDNGTCSREAATRAGLPGTVPRGFRRHDC